MCDMGEDITERKGFKKYRGSCSVSGKKEWLQSRPWQCRYGVHGVQAQNPQGHSHPAASSSGPSCCVCWITPCLTCSQGHIHRYQLVMCKIHFVYLLCMCYRSASPQQGELRAGAFRLDCLEGITDILLEHLTNWVCRGAQFTVL